MSKNITNAQIMEAINALTANVNARFDAQDARIAALEGKKQAKGGKDKAPAKELVEFVKRDGTVKLVSQAQADAWDKHRNREHMTLDEVKACSFDGKFTDEMNSWLAKNPVCTCKEFKAQFAAARGCTKEQLKAHKTELRANGQMK